MNTIKVDQKDVIVEKVKSGIKRRRDNRLAKIKEKKIEFSKLSYEEKINSFIDDAFDEARLKVAKEKITSLPLIGADGKRFDFCVVTMFFHQAMDRMTKEAGIRLEKEDGIQLGVI